MATATETSKGKKGNTPDAPPAPPESTAPGTESGKGKEKKEKRKRVQYEVPEGGLNEWPADFDSKKHKPLRRKDFSDETVWLERKATQLEASAKRYRQEAETIRKLGDGPERGKAKKLIRVQAELQQLREALEAQGVDTTALLGIGGEEE